MYVSADPGAAFRAPCLRLSHREKTQESESAQTDRLRPHDDIIEQTAAGKASRSKPGATYVDLPELGQIPFYAVRPRPDGDARESPLGSPKDSPR